MKFYDAGKENFELCEIDGKPVAFTNARIDRDTVPEGLHCYDIRDSDLCDGTCAEVKNGHVWVNHWGTVLTKTPFEFDKDGYYFPAEEMSYVDCGITAQEMLTKSEQELIAPQQSQSSGQIQTFGY